MPNLYTNLAELKDTLKIQSDANDPALLAMSEQVARSLDAYCHRRFYPYTATLRFDSNRGLYLDLGRFDLLSLTSLKVDEDGDGTFEITLNASEYLLRPANTTPAEGILINTARATQLSSWPQGPERVEAAGRWGYSQATEPIGTLGEAINSTTATTLTLAADHTGQPGQTFVIDSEDLYCSNIEGNVATVSRGENGTTAATHLINAPVRRRRADELIERVSLIQCARLWRDTPTGGGNASAEQFGGFSPNTLYPMVRDMLAMRRRVAAGVR